MLHSCVARCGRGTAPEACLLLLSSRRRHPLSRGRGSWRAAGRTQLAPGAARPRGSVGNFLVSRARAPPSQTPHQIAMGKRKGKTTPRKPSAGQGEVPGHTYSTPVTRAGGGAAAGRRLGTLDLHAARRASRTPATTTCTQLATRPCTQAPPTPSHCSSCGMRSCERSRAGRARLATPRCAGAASACTTPRPCCALPPRAGAPWPASAGCCRCLPACST